MSIDEFDRLVEKLDLEGKVRLLTGATVWSTHAEPDIGLRSMITSDGPVGVRGEGWDERNPSLTLPSATALAATWDEDLVGLLGGLLAAEARRKGVHVLLAPTLNLHRSPLGGRHFECYSEDPLLTGRIGAACVRGIQAGGVAATAKHYVANDSETERLTLDAHVDEQTLRELYLAPFEAAVEAGVWAVMSAYNGVNGTTMSESPLLADPLKAAWRFDGVVVSDWGGVRSAGPAARAAQDLAMPGPCGPWGETLVAAVRAGEVPEAAIDDKVRRLLRLASRVGALDLAPAVLPEPTGPGDHGPARALLRRAVAASTVLLRNEDALLPLDPSRLRRVAVLGPNAAAVRIQGGGSAGVYPLSVVSPLDGIRDALSGIAEVVHSPGAHLDDRPTPLGTDNARNPLTGEPGVLIRLLDAAGAEVHAEHRLTGRILEPARIDSAAPSPVAGCPPPGPAGRSSPPSRRMGRLPTPRAWTSVTVPGCGSPRRPRTGSGTDSATRPGPTRASPCPKTPPPAARPPSGYGCATPASAPGAKSSRSTCPGRRPAWPAPRAGWPATPWPTRVPARSSTSRWTSRHGPSSTGRPSITPGGPRRAPSRCSPDARPPTCR
ncbi:beta-glucosidase-like glycosyl hydrolase [Streptosporangium album]|uniref:Beta-glucosidase-like glycosyl hydrolase n=1 Tax=Streptosporangium album TaxID=47479 RepID=A0A7W7RU45_9ACTN|nr:beta-glucosidase-like glycosyl hydrolase [Streptosporangium album]